MNVSKLMTHGSIFPSVCYFFVLFLTLCTTLSAQEEIINSKEEIVVYTKSGPITVDAKIDTGATSSSVGKEFVEENNLEPYTSDEVDQEHDCPKGKKYVVSGLGKQCRDRVKISFSIRGNIHHSIATVANRKHLSTPVLIGRRDLTGTYTYLVRPLAVDDNE